MIQRFRQVGPKLFRGSAPSIEDVVLLHKKFGITKIVSLDAIAGKRINRVCKLLGIKHIILPIDIGHKSSLLNFLEKDITSLLSDGKGKVFIHCHSGKDRTGLAIALYRCEHDGWSADKAIREAKKLGFGIGVPPFIVKLYEKLIHQACKEDINSIEEAYKGSWDIVNNQRSYPSDYHDYTLDGWEQQSWSPFADYRVREFPYSPVDNAAWPEQYDTRITHDLDDSGPVKGRNIEMPQSGQYDNAAGEEVGFGPSAVSTGFI
jgi:hypothetical protein